MTRVVNLLGADIARELMPPAPANNESGFWEPIAVTKIHDRLLKALASSWDDPFPLPDRWTETDAARRAKGRLADEIGKDFADSSLFVVKDPALRGSCRCGSKFSTNSPSSLLSSYRSETLLKLPPRSRRAIDFRWRSPCCSTLTAISRPSWKLGNGGGSSCATTNCWTTGGPFAARLELVAGSPLDATSAERAAEIEGFLTAELRHHHYSRADLSQTHDIAATVVEMFDRMSAAADGGAETELRPAFDRLRQTLSEATRLYRGLVMAERAMALAELVHMRKDRDEVKARATAEIAAQHGDIERLQAELELDARAGG